MRSHTSESDLTDRQTAKPSMNSAVQHRNYFLVQMLIRKKDEERPLTYLFATSTDSLATPYINLKSIELFKQKIIAIFQSKERDSAQTQCKIAELFITNPTAALNQEISENAERPERKFIFEYFFAWAAKNNRLDLLLKPSFGHLFVNFPESAATSLIIALVFGSKDYAKRAVVLTGDPNTIKYALNIAIALDDRQMVYFIVGFLSKFGLDLKDFSCPARRDPDVPAITEEPLYWAIREQREVLVDDLIQGGINPNGYLHFAIRIGNIPIVRLLLTNGATTQCKNILSDTPLHEAVTYKKWDIAFMLVKEFNADIYALNDSKRTPLDDVKDPEIKDKLLALYHKRDSEKLAPKLNLGFLSTAKVKDDKKPEPPNRSLRS